MYGCEGFGRRCYAHSAVRGTRLAGVFSTIALTGGLLACATLPTFSIAPQGDAGIELDALVPDAGMVDAEAPTDGSDGSAPLDGGKQAYRIFITSNLYSGVLPEPPPRAYADSQCKAAAQSGGLGGSWMAVLWTPLGADPLASLNPSPDGWHQVMPGGAAGAIVLTALPTLGRTSTPIQTEFGRSVANATVWTGGNQSAIGLTCGTWNLGSATGSFGDPNASDEAWLIAGQGQCTTMRSFYCIEQPPPP